MKFKILFLFLLASVCGWGQVTENFDGLNQGSYGNYNYNGFQITNGLCNNTNARTGNAIRLRDASTSLEYVGSDGNGKDGGVGVISFWYRSWDNNPAAQYIVEANINGAGYNQIGVAINTTSTNYVQWSHTMNNTNDNIRIRITRTTGERLHIDDFSITNYTSSCTAPTTPNGTFSGNQIGCNSTDIIYTHGSGQPETDIDYYWQTSATGTSTASAVNSGANYNVTSSGNYYVRAYNSDTDCWSSATTGYPVVINSTINSTASSPNPSNNNMSVCYSGTGAVTAISWTAATGATSYDVYFGTSATPSYVDNVTTTSYTVGTLSPDTTYYWKIVPRNDCGETTGSPVTWNFTTEDGPCYCTSNPTSNDNDGIESVTVGSVTFPVSDVTYYNYTGAVPDLVQGETVVSSITFDTGYTYNTHIWIDFNDDGIFDNGTVIVFSGESTNSRPTVLNTSFLLSGTANLGLHKMRIGTADNGQSSPNPCYSGTYGVTIDLNVNIIAACTPPADPVGSINGDTETCSATSLTYSGTDISNAYWQTTSTGTSTTNPASTPYVIPTTPGTYTVYVRIHDGDCWSTGTVQHTITVNATPSITNQPDDANATIGGTATFTVVATGNDLTYAWEVSTDCGGSWSPVGGNTATLSVTPVTLAMNGYQYRVMISNSCGSIISDIAYLNVVNEDECLITSFSTDEGWPNNTGYTSGTYTVGGNTWITNNVNITTDRIQIDDIIGSWIELPLLNNPIKIVINSRLSGAGSIIFKAQFYNTSTSVWEDLDQETVINSTWATYEFDLSSITSYTNNRVRLFQTSTDRPIYVDDLTVFCMTPHTETDYTWTGNADTTSWDDACNWQPIGIPTEIDNVRFIHPTTSTNTLNITDARTVNNLTLEDEGVFDVDATGNFTVNGTIAFDGSDGATATFDCASTFNIASPDPQTIPPLNYGNLNASGGNRILVSDKTVGICTEFTVGAGTYTMNQSIVDYNGSGNQTINSALTYYNLKVSGSGNKIPFEKVLTVNNITYVTSGTLLIPESDDDELPYALYALGGIDVEATGTLLLQNNAVLMQDPGATNTGSITQKRNATVPSNQYNYWSIPVQGQNVYSIYDDIPANRVMTYNTSNDYFTIKPNPTTALFGIGYSVKGPSTNAPSDGEGNKDVTATFIGTPNNEASGMNTITVPTHDSGDNFNLIGNPFPSNLDLVKMYDEGNAASTGNADKFVEPTAYFWDNIGNTEMYQQGSDYNQTNYAFVNLASGQGTIAPCTYCDGSASGKKPNGIVKPGQGFIINVKGSSTPSTTSITVNNAMRTTGIMRGTDQAFYFKNGNSPATDEAERNDQFWLELVNPNGLHIQAAIGYFKNAQDTYEIYDSEIMSESLSDNIYTLSKDAVKLTIQGREGNFKNTDVIPLGVKFFVNGKYKIQLEETKGIFIHHQNIYLKDKAFNILHNLSVDGPYEIDGVAGEYTDRFEIVFKNGNTEDGPVLTTASQNKINILKRNNQIEISSSKDKIKEVEIFNLSGWSIYKNAEVNQNVLRIPSSLFGKQIIIVKIETETGEIQTKKFVNQ